MGLVKIITKPIGCILSLIGFIVVVAVLLFVGFIWAVDEFTPQLAENALSEATGFPTSVQDGSVSFKNQTFTLTDIDIRNPDDFPDRDFMHIAEFTVGLDRKNTNEQHLTLSQVTLDIAELSYVQGSMSVSNLEAFIQSAEENWAQLLQRIYEQAAEKDQAVPEKLMITKLNLKLARVKLASIEDNQTIYRAIDIGYSKTFDNVDSIRPVIESIAADLQSTGLPQIAKELDQAAREKENDATLKMLQETLEKTYQQDKEQ